MLREKHCYTSAAREKWDAVTYCSISFNSHRDVTCDQLYEILVSIRLWCHVWDTLCPYLDITYAHFWTWPKTDIRLSKNRHKPSFTCQGSPQDTSALLSFVDWRLGKIVDSAHFICRHSLNRNGSICKS